MLLLLLLLHATIDIFQKRNCEETRLVLDARVKIRKTRDRNKATVLVIVRVILVFERRGYLNTEVALCKLVPVRQKYRLHVVRNEMDQMGVLTQQIVANDAHEVNERVEIRKQSNVLVAKQFIQLPLNHFSTLLFHPRKRTRTRRR